jgi:deglycase
MFISTEGREKRRPPPLALKTPYEELKAMPDLKGLKVAILATDGFEQAELTEPRKVLDQAGADTAVVSPNNNEIRGWNGTGWGDTVKVDMELQRARPEQFDALLLPGGVMNPAKLRMDSKAVQFVKSFFDLNKPVAAICHGPWTIVEAGAARGRKIASWPSIKTDMRNAGAEWIDLRSGDRRQSRFRSEARRHSGIQQGHGRALRSRPTRGPRCVPLSPLNLRRPLAGKHRLAHTSL